MIYPVNLYHCDINDFHCYYSHYGLNTYGADVRPQGTWNRLVNTDFSAGIKLTGSLNSRHDRVWAESEEAAGDLLEFPEDKHDISFMVTINSKSQIVCLPF